MLRGYFGTTMLISDQYRDQNAEMHRTKPIYGSYGAVWAMPALEIAERRECKTILDYGCGKGEFGRLMREATDSVAVVDYDPAIEGKTFAPPCDLIVCTDVLEHVEPECLDDVLRHICHIATKAVFFNIATRPAEKHLPDGRNAHLIIQPAHWWKGQIEKYFDIETWNVEEGSVSCELLPLRALAHVETFPAVSDEFRNEHVRLNCQRISKRVGESWDFANDTYAPHNRTAILVCFGPSLKDTWPAVALEMGNDKSDIVSVSAAHKFLLEKGIVPSIHIDCDPREHKAIQIGDPHKAVQYWLASCIHPSYLDKLEGYDVSLWHSYNGPASKMAVHVNAPGEKMVLGGGSVGVRAISVLFARGYRRFVIHGMDGSFSNGKCYAGDHLGKAATAPSTSRVKCGDRWFETSGTLISYANFFLKQVGFLRYVDPSTIFELCGDGLLQHMVKTGETK